MIASDQGADEQGGNALLLALTCGQLPLSIDMGDGVCRPLS